MPFFNRLCSTSPLAAALAIRTNSAVVPAAIFTSGFARWRIVYFEEIPYDRSNPEQLTADINAVLESQIRQSPADWFWVHNRWKTPWPNLLIARQKRGIYLPSGTDPTDAAPLSFHYPLTKLARRRRHEPAGRACIQARPPRRPACRPHSGKT